MMSIWKKNQLVSHLWSGRWVLACVAVMFPAACRADDAEVGMLKRWQGPERPVIGLVLSGGGARGAAHLGVLRVIEALRVPVDIVVGTSAGSIVGGAYATGMRLEDIEAEMRKLNTAELVHDRLRNEVPLERKADDAVNYVGPELGWRDGQLVLPRGAVAGVALEAVLRRLASRQRDQDFDRLPIRFRAIATDAGSAEMVVLDRGSLSTAMRASMAIPAVVNPVTWNGRLLVDGGVSRNLPVDVARAMGAQVVIAVDISTPLRSPKQLGSLLDMVDQMTRMLTASNLKRSLAELRDEDVLIQPDLGDLSSADFDHLEKAAAAGMAASWRAKEMLARYSMEPQAYGALVARRTQEPDAPLAGERLAAVEISGASRVSEDAVRAAITTQAGQHFDAERAEADMRRLFGRGDFEHVSYVLTQEPGKGQVLHTELSEKSWGPQYLRLGLGMSSDFEGNAFFSLFASHRWTWLNRLGGEWRNQVTLGHADRLLSEWFQPLSPAQRVFAAARVTLDRSPFDLYKDNVRLASYRRQREQLALELGAPLGEIAEARVGIVRGRVRMLTDTSVLPGSELLPQTDTGGVVMRLRWDSLDNLRFPRSGSLLDAEFYAARPSLGAEDSYRKLSVTAKAAAARGPHSLQLGVQISDKLGSGTLPDYELVSLGGFLQLSGYRTGQQVGSTMRFGRLVYNYRISGPGVLDGAYLGASLEAGRIGDVLKKSAGARTLYGGALYIAVDTPLGPVYLGYGHAGGNNQALYLFLGQP